MEDGAVLDFAVELGYQLQIAGGEIFRVEESMSRVLAAYGFRTGEIFAIPNCIFASIVTPSGEAVTRVRRVPGHGTDIWLLEEVNGLCRSLCARPVPVEEAKERLDRIVRDKRRYPLPLSLAGNFVGAGFFALFFGGSWADGLCAGLCGIAIGLTILLLDSVKANLFIKTVAGGGVSSLLASLLVLAGLGGSVDLITIGALMILVPGVALTNAVRDIMAGDMVSGISKLGEALLIATAIALGTGLGMAVTQLVGGRL